MSFIRWFLYFLKELLIVLFFITTSTVVIKEIIGGYSYHNIFLVLIILYFIDILISFLYHKFDLIFKTNVDYYNTEEYNDILKKIDIKKFTPFSVKIFRLKKESTNNAYARFGTIIIEGSENETTTEKEFTVGHELAHIVNNHWLLIHLSKRMNQLTMIMSKIFQISFFPFLLIKNTFLKLIIGALTFSFLYRSTDLSSMQNFLGVFSLHALNIIFFKFLIREKEYEADIFAKTIVGNKGGIEFFEKVIAQRSKIDAFLEFIKEPISTHPNIVKRIKYLKKINSIFSLKIERIRNLLFIVICSFTIFILLPRHKFKNEIVRPYKEFYSYFQTNGFRTIASEIKSYKKILD